VRLALLILLAAGGWLSPAARADGAFIRVDFDSAEGFIVPRDYAEDHKADLTSTIPGAMKVDAFWTPSEADVYVAERVLHSLIEDSVKDPSKLFPDLAVSKDSDDRELLKQQRAELVLVLTNYDRYLRQYVGIIIDGQKLVFCNYSSGIKADPSADYIFIDKVFDPDGAFRFLQCRVDPKEKTCCNVSMIGSWQPKEKP
jgi:hypothetical protein